MTVVTPDRLSLVGTAGRPRHPVQGDQECRARRTPTADANVVAGIREQLTGPGGPFEIVRDVVAGVEMKVFKDRFPSLRVVAQFGAAHGDKEFIVYGDRRITFADFLASANSISNALLGLGIANGDRVAVLAQNCPEWCMTFWGTVDIGAVLVGLNGWWNTDEIIYGLEDSGARILVVDAKRYERIADAVDAIDTLERVYLIDGDASQATSAKVHDFDELLTEPTSTFPDVPIDEEDHAVIFYTSGTTGRPKGAISSHRNMVANLQNTVFLLTATSMAQAAAAAGDESESLTPPGTQPVALFSAPLFHVAGLPLHPRRRDDGRAQAGDDRGQVRPGEGAVADRGRAGDVVDGGADDGLASLRGPRTPRLRHVLGRLGQLRRVAVGRRDAAPGP